MKAKFYWQLRQIWHAPTQYRYCNTIWDKGWLLYLARKKQPKAYWCILTSIYRWTKNNWGYNWRAIVIGRLFYYQPFRCWGDHTPKCGLSRKWALKCTYLCDLLETKARHAEENENHLPI